jgi:DNA repair exonuclease SbcCD ATPase subunit
MPNVKAPSTKGDKVPKKEDSSITLYSSTSNSDVDDSPDLLDGLSVAIDFVGHNKNLENENKRLQQLVSEYEKQLAEVATIDEVLNDDSGAVDLAMSNVGDEKIETRKLRGKIQSLKAKRREEKIKNMQLQKSVETHSAEIEGLQRELNRSLNDLDELHKDRIQDKSQLAKLGKQLGEAAHRLKQVSAREADQEKQINSLEEVVQKQNEELEVTLELLQSKVVRIMELEDELDHRSNGYDKNGRQAALSSKKEFKESQDEIKKLKRQNMMLKLLVEELEEHRKQGDNSSDIDSVFMRLPRDLRPQAPQHHALPFSVGLRALDFYGGEARTVDEDLLSIDTNGAVPFIEGYGKTNFRVRDDGIYHDSEPNGMSYNTDTEYG